MDRFTTREEWLVAACDQLIPALKAAGAGATPKYRVSVGWPKGSRGGKGGSHTIGQCFCSSASADGTYEIFISPVLAEVTGSQGVLATLLHELVHAFVGIRAKHGKEFRIVAERVGLIGKMTATEAGKELQERLHALADQLGKYPHAALTGAEGMRPKQTTRMLKLECPTCGYTVRTTAKWLIVGFPTCPCGSEMSNGTYGSEGE